MQEKKIYKKKKVPMIDQWETLSSLIVFLKFLIDNAVPNCFELHKTTLINTLIKGHLTGLLNCVLKEYDEVKKMLLESVKNIHVYKKNNLISNKVRPTDILFREFIISPLLIKNSGTTICDVKYSFNHILFKIKLLITPVYYNIISLYTYNNVYNTKNESTNNLFTPKPVKSSIIRSNSIKDLNDCIRPLIKPLDLLLTAVTDALAYLNSNLAYLNSKDINIKNLKVYNIFLKVSYNRDFVKPLLSVDWHLFKKSLKEGTFKGVKAIKAKKNNKCISKKMITVTNVPKVIHRDTCPNFSILHRIRCND